MDRNFYDKDEFEEFLKQKSDQYKMYPSDRVWNNIYSSLHGRKKWLILGFTMLFIGSVLFIGRQAVLSNYTRMATQINSSPEILLVPATSLAPASVSVNGSTGALPTHAIHPILPASAQGSKNIFSRPSVDFGTPTGSNNFTSLEGQYSNTNAFHTNQDLFSELLITKATITPAAIIFPITAEGPVPGIKPLEKMNAAVTASYAPETSPLSKTTKPAKWFLQLYASPTISYRRLSSLNEPGSYSSPVSSGYAGNVNNYVHHRPAAGFEAGGNVQYKLSNNLSIYTGLQLNYSRYYINAYKYHVEKASIALNASRSDTLSGYTDIRNFSGYAPEQIQNQYWQLSVPIGIQIKLLGDKKLQLSVAGGIQPTFLLHSNSFLISSDYKNYIQSPDLARSFNVHTNFEAFLSYQTGAVKWQLGPQFRSQLLSSYSNQYRVREYLTEVGIKFGITKTLH